MEHLPDHLVLEYEIPKYDGDMVAPNLSCTSTRISAGGRSRPSWGASGARRQALVHRGPVPRDPAAAGDGIDAPSGHAEAFYCRKAVLGGDRESRIAMNGAAAVVLEDLERMCGSLKESWRRCGQAPARDGRRGIPRPYSCRRCCTQPAAAGPADRDHGVRQLRARDAGVALAPRGDPNLTLVRHDITNPLPKDMGAFRSSSTPPPSRRRPTTGAIRSRPWTPTSTACASC